MGGQFNEDGDLLLSFVVTAMDQGVPSRMAQTTVSFSLNLLWVSNVIVKGNICIYCPTHNNSSTAELSVFLPILLILP